MCVREREREREKRRAPPTTPFLSLRTKCFVQRCNFPVSRIDKRASLLTPIMSPSPFFPLPCTYPARYTPRLLSGALFQVRVDVYGVS